MSKINDRFETITVCCSLKCTKKAWTARCVKDDYGILVWIYICKECSDKYVELDKQREKNGNSTN